MKNLNKILLSVLVALMSSPAMSKTITKSFSSHTMTYETTSDSQCELVGVKIQSDWELIEVPDFVEDESGNQYAVVKISPDAFSNNYSSGNTLSVGENLVSHIEPWSGNGLFTWSCNIFSKLIFRDGVTKIPSVLFGWSGSNIEEIYLGRDVKTIETFAFVYAGNLRTINTENVETIGDYAFVECNSLYRLDLSKLRHIPCLSWGYLNLSEIKFGNDVVSVDASSLKRTQWYQNQTNTIYIGKVLMECMGKDLFYEDYTVKDGTVAICGDAFAKMNNLRTLSLPSSLEDLNANCPKVAFNIASDNPNIKSVDGIAYSKDGRTLLRVPYEVSDYSFPSEVDSIAPSAFEGNQGIERLQFPQIQYLSPNCIAGCSALKELELPSTLKAIQGASSFTSPFTGCVSLKEINIPAGAVFDGIPEYSYYEGSYGTYLFSLESYNIPDDHPQLKSIDGVLYNKRGNVLVFYPQGKQAISFTIPEQVDTISNNAFNFNRNLQKIVIGREDIYMTIGIFTNMTNLREIELPKHIYCSGLYFDYSPLLKSVVLPEMTNERNSVYCSFRQCSSLESVVLSKSITELYQNAFEGCKNLKSLMVKAETPPSVSSYVWDINLRENKKMPFYDVNVTTCKLYVPKQSLDAYRTTESWKEFDYILPLESASNNGKKCKEPVISIENNELVVKCPTSDAVCHTTITCEDNKMDVCDRTIPLSGIYRISTYATADGYYNSETVTKMLYWSKPSLDAESEATLVGDVNEDGEVDVNDVVTLVGIILDK